MMGAEDMAAHENCCEPKRNGKTEASFGILAWMAKATDEIADLRARVEALEHAAEVDAEIESGDDF